MSEIKTTGIDELSQDRLDGFRQIKPEESMPIDKAKSFFNDLFSREIKPIDITGVDFADKSPADSFPENPRYIITRNESLENSRHPITGVQFEKKVVELPSGEKIEGVFPVFDSVFDAKIPENLYLQKDEVQFKNCNEQLLKTIERDPELKSIFSEEQMDQIHDGIKDGTAPDGYVWHHDAEPGKLQLISFDVHSHTGHTGGRTVWGGGSENR